MTGISMRNAIYTRRLVRNEMRKHKKRQNTGTQEITRDHPPSLLERGSTPGAKSLPQIWKNYESSGSMNGHFPILISGKKVCLGLAFPLISIGK